MKVFDDNPSPMAISNIEGELKLRTSYLNAIIENQPGLVWLKDKDSKFLKVNNAFAISCGFGEPKMVEGKNDYDIWPIELAEKYRADDLSVMVTGNSKIVEELIADQGEEIWFETYKSPVKDKDGIIMWYNRICI